MTARKPIRIYKRSSRSITEPERVYKDTDDYDRLSITQQVLEHPESSWSVQNNDDQSKYEELLHTIYDAVLISDREGNIFEVNARAEYHFAWSSDELVQMNVVDLISGADQQLLTVLRQNVSSRKYTVLEAICMRGDETRFNAEIVVNRLRGKDKTTLCFFVRDITAKKQAEDELRHASDRLVEAEKIQARVDTLSTLSYAINNPLQILTCMAEIDDNQEYKIQIGRIASVLNQLRQEESLEEIIDDEGETIYGLPETVELEPCNADRILIVDDEAVLRNMFIASIQKEFQVTKLEEAGNGKEAISKFQEHRHGLIIMDVSMPVMNGEQAFDSIAELCKHNNWQLPIFIFCSGFVISENVKEIIADGTYHTCLSKPLSIKELIDVVRERLALLSMAGK